MPLCGRSTVLRAVAEPVLGRGNDHNLPALVLAAVQRLPHGHVFPRGNDDDEGESTAGGLGVISLLPDLTGSEVLGVMLLGLSFATAATAYRRWALNESAMRLGAPLPVSRIPQVMGVSTAAIAVTAAVLFVIDQL